MSADRVVLVGAGDHGRGVLEILRRSAEVRPPGVEVLGFVDDDPDADDVDGVRLLGTTDWLVTRLASLDTSVLLCLAAPQSKRVLAAKLSGAGARWAGARHPRADLAPSAEVGEGSILAAGVTIVYEARVGAHVTVNLHATIGHHVHIGDFTTVAPGANVLGHVRIGEACQVHANAVILPSVVLGEGCVVGAGSVVLRDVPPGVKVFGNPARAIPTL
jgi:sugar O-acyltransferase (sialic acid O-acetyltransferase NeuD family)